jgi:hypothetical protein
VTKGSNQVRLSPLTKGFLDSDADSISGILLSLWPQRT